ncbi:MAG: glyoxalase/bleomycin resistance/extradiol dioxygenase family protein [Labilithrix sp.]
MTVRAANPYVILNGHADRAIAFYTTALEAQTRALMRFGDNNPSCAEALKNNVMHCELRIGDASVMLSDGPGVGELPPSGIVQIALDLDDPEEAKKLFANLAERGAIVQELFAAPWGALFGALRDPFGVQWMFNAKL